MTSVLGHDEDGNAVVGSSDRLLQVPLPSVAEHPSRERRRGTSPNGVPLSARGSRDRSFGRNGNRPPSIDRPIVREYTGALRMRSHSPPSSSTTNGYHSHGRNGVAPASRGYAGPSAGARSGYAGSSALGQ